MNSPVEQPLLAALTQLENTVKAPATAKPGLLPLFAEIDRLAAQLPPGTDPTLLHYLHKKSYAKARRFLEGEAGDPASRNPFDIHRSQS
jgi:hypothetical protein